VPARFAAADAAVDELDWSTEPSLPGLPMRTEMALLLGLYWVDVASEVDHNPMRVSRFGFALASTSGH